MDIYHEMGTKILIFAIYVTIQPYPNPRSRLTSRHVNFHNVSLNPRLDNMSSAGRRLDTKSKLFVYSAPTAVG